MMYNREELPHYVRTAGKVTVLTALTGLLVFVVAFMFDVGTQEFNRVSAQNQFASTTLTVLNTPPEFRLNAFEVPDSSTTTPTNSGEVQSWQAIAFDSNGAPYFLLVCAENATPTANQATPGNLGTAPPECAIGVVQWGVSAPASSTAVATVSTTTAEAGTGNFAEVNSWFAWVCDDDPVSPQCNIAPVTGPTSTAASSSPFHVNNRPVLSGASNDGPVDPGDIINFLTTSSDPDTVGGSDGIFITVCDTNTLYDSVTDTCTDFVASSTVGVDENASTSRLITIPTRDQLYGAYVYIYDEHGHEALANPIQADFTVRNVAPRVLGGEIDLNGGSDLILTNPATQTPGFTLDFTLRDNNSCLNSASSSEITDFQVAIFRADLRSTSTCDGTAGTYDPNNCYPSEEPTWNLSCTATTTCASPLQDSIDYTCTFPLWFLADPTDEINPNIPTAFGDDFWTAAVAGIDDNFATGTLSTTTNDVNLQSFTAIDILAANIAYAPTAPGNNTQSVNATSTALNVGNTGLDQEVFGTDMCRQFSATTTCPVSSTSTIPAAEQQFASSTFGYGAAFAISLSTTSPGTELELNVPKTTSTIFTNFERGTTYWGIAVPATINLAGSYRGLNTFTQRQAEPADW